mgnify:FL=1
METSQLKVGDKIKLINEVKTIQRFEFKKDLDTTYTIITKYNNFFAGNVLVHSEIT